MTLTLDPVAADWTQEVGIEAVGFLNLIQEFPDVHHLRGSSATASYGFDCATPFIRWRAVKLLKR